MEKFQKFVEFLESMSCRKEFNEAFYIQNPGLTLNAKIWDILGADECFVGKAFDWAQTEQGHDYWFKIDEALYEYYLKNL